MIKQFDNNEWCVSTEMDGRDMIRARDEDIFKYQYEQQPSLSRSRMHWLHFY